MSIPRRRWVPCELIAALAAVCLLPGFSGLLSAFERASVASSPRETVIDYTVPPPVLGVKQSPSGALFSVVKMPGAGHSSDLGRPDLPFLVDDVSVPRRGLVSVSVEVLGVTRRSVPHWVYPRQPPVRKVPGALARQGFVIDRDWYEHKVVERKAFAPEVTTRVYRRRGERVVRVIVPSCDYEPASGQLRVPARIRLRVTTADPALPPAAGPRTGLISIVSVRLQSRADVRTLVEMGLDIKTVRTDRAVIYATDDEMIALVDAGFTLEVIGRQPVADEKGGGDLKALSGFHNFSDIETMLTQYAAEYPEQCRLQVIGTSVNGRDILALKITDFPDVEEDEPEVKFVGGIHGDEVPSVELCLRFIDRILTTYATDVEVRALVDGCEIWVVPVMNPDGYELGWRTNASGVDLNRSFPEGSSESIGTIFSGPDMDLTGRPPETIALMEWSAAQSFVLSATFHSGALVANYPYDNDGIGSTFSPTPDQDEFLWLAETYAALNLPMWNSTEFTHGVSNGAAWYAIDGGMQDWLYRYTGCFDITMEISESDLPSEAQMETLWTDNRDAMLAYLQCVRTGVRGLVTDADDGTPVYASVSVAGRATRTFTDPDVGDYHRILKAGTYDITLSAPGYVPATFTDVTISEGGETRLDVALEKGAAAGSTVIVVHHADHDGAYAAYRDQKQSEGFIVSEVRLSGTPTADSVRTEVQAAYASTGAEFVVLMGDVDVVPTFYNDDYSVAAHSDLPYALLDAGETFDDYLGKDVGLGRLSLDSDAELQEYVTKLTAFVSGSRHEHLTWVSGGATPGENDIAEGTHDYVMANYIDSGTYTNQLFYRDTGSASELTAAINAGTDGVIYSGHGEEAGWLRYDYDGADLANLSNALDAPIVLGHCCLTGSLELDDCFAEEWLLTNARAIVYVGASDSSLWDEDDVLQKKEFEWMATYPGAPIAEALDYGLEQTAATYPGSAEYYFTIYHVFGDPTVALLGEALTVRHTPLADTSSSSGPYLVQATVTAQDPIESATLYWRSDPGNAYTAVDMTGSKDAVYSAEIPGQPYGTSIEYYLRVTDVGAREVLAPETAPGTPYSFDVGLLIAHNSLPNTLNTSEPYTVAAAVEADVAVTASLYWSVDGGEFVSVAMIPQGGGFYTADIPAQPSGSEIAYYIEAGGGGFSATHPDAAPGSTHTFLVDTSPPVFGGVSSADPGDGRVVLSWSAATDASQPVTYLVFRAESSGAQDFDLPLGSTDSLTYIDDTVGNSESYFYVVRAQDVLGNRETNTVERVVTPSAPEQIFSWTLETNPGWTREGAWGFGEPAGRGGLAHGHPDPTSGYTGVNVFGYNLLGDYANSMPARYLISDPFDCSDLTDVTLRFQRWLNVEQPAYDEATVEVSCDGGLWHVVWQNETEITDSAWQSQNIDLSAYADGCSAVRVRWGMGPTDGSWLYSGWNIDDIEIWGVRAPDGHRLDVTVTPPGAGSVTLDPPPGPDGRYADGTVVTLLAEAATGYTFDAWSGELTGGEPGAQITMTRDAAVTAAFTPLPTDFVTLLSVGVPSGASFPTIAAQVTVETDAGLACELGPGDFSVSEDGVAQTVLSVVCDETHYDVTYTTSHDASDGSIRDVMVTATDPVAGPDADGGSYTAPLDDSDLTAARELVNCAEPGTTIEVAITLDYAGTGVLTSLSVTDTLPEAWSFQGVTSDSAPAIQPTIGATGALEFSWITIPVLPHTMTYQVMIPTDETAESACFAGEAAFRTDGAEASRSVAGMDCLDVGDCCAPHDADQNENWHIELTPELTRLIQFYNSGAYHCQAGTEDDYAPGAGATDCSAHGADQNGNWMIELTPELTRLIQFYNSGGYHCQEGTEDGYAPGIDSRKHPPAGKAAMTVERTFSPAAYDPGGTVDVTVSLDHGDPARLTSLALLEQLPAGWSFEQAVGGSVPAIQPAPGATGELGFGWLLMPTTWPATFTFRVQTPIDATGCVSFSGRVSYREDGGEIDVDVAGDGDICDVGTPDWQWVLHLEGADKDSVAFGMSPGATDGYDADMDLDASPNPPAGAGGIWFETDGFEYAVDMRAPNSVACWILDITPDDALDLTISWSEPPGIPEDHAVVMLEIDDTGERIPDGMGVDLRRDNSVNIPAAGNRTFMLQYMPAQHVDIDLIAGWNMVSIPLDPLLPAVEDVFADAAIGDTAGVALRDGGRGVIHADAVWGWNAMAQAYRRAQSVQALAGYWVYASTDVTVRIVGNMPASTEMPLETGWNLLGPADGFAVTPAGTPIRGLWWCWAPAFSRYQPVSELKPGQAYWVNSASPTGIQMMPSR